MTDYFTSSAQLDEHMAEVVKKYNLLYDKQRPGYRDESVKAQTWQKVADECDVGTGEAARKLFDNLKKRFLKKRLKFRKLKAGGMPPELVNAAKEEMDSYSFLNWLVPHIRMRRTKRDLNVMEMSGMMEVKREFFGSDEGGSSFDEQETFDDEGEMENASMVSSSANYIKASSALLPPSTPTPPSHDQHPTMTNGTTNGESLKRKSMEMLRVKTEGVPYKKRGYNTHISPVYGKLGHVRKEDSQLDDIDLFGKMIAAEIKHLPARDQCIAKHQIHTVLFELKMSNFSQTNSQWQSAQPVYVVSGGSMPASHRSQSRIRSGYNMEPFYPADSSLKENNE